MIELSIFVCWIEKANKEREDEYSRQETIIGIIA